MMDRVGRSEPWFWGVARGHAYCASVAAGCILTVVGCGTANAFPAEDLEQGAGNAAPNCVGWLHLAPADPSCPHGLERSSTRTGDLPGGTRGDEPGVLFDAGESGTANAGHADAGGPNTGVPGTEAPKLADPGAGDPDGRGPGDGGTSLSGGPAGSPGNGPCSDTFHDPERLPTVLRLRGDVVAHDPSAIDSGGTVYLFHTGARGIRVMRSEDLISWHERPPLLSETRPAWHDERVPGVRELWSPDISRFGGTYHLYYALSTPSMGRSCIGHATAQNLDSTTWTDEGPVLCADSQDLNDQDWNANDPHVFLASDGTPWLLFGSGGSGIMILELDAQGSRTVTTEATHPLAAGDGQHDVRAPSLVRHCGYYYLFVSSGKCCMGARSTLEIRVGRAAELLGPYLDRSGKPMLEGGGTVVLRGGDRWRGPGSNSVLLFGEQTYILYHAYDARSEGRHELRVAELSWDETGWPMAGGP